MGLFRKKEEEILRLKTDGEILKTKLETKQNNILLTLKLNREYEYKNEISLDIFEIKPVFNKKRHDFYKKYIYEEYMKKAIDSIKAYITETNPALAGYSIDYINLKIKDIKTAEVDRDVDYVTHNLINPGTLRFRIKFEIEELELIKNIIER